MRFFATVRRVMPDAPSDLASALKKSEERYRFLAENIPVQVWTSRPNGMLDYVSSRAVLEFGISMTQLLSEGWKNVVHPEDLERAVERWVKCLGTGGVYEVEFRLRMADGSYAWYLARAVAQRDANGGIVEWLGTNTNIAEQRETQRRTEALLVEVGEQARETEAALTRLRAEKAAADATIKALEAKLAAR